MNIIIMSIPGLTYIKEAVPVDTREEITAWFFSEEVQTTLIPITNSPKSRKVLHYGYKYNYANKSVHDEAEPIPDIIKQLLEYIPMEDEGAGAYFNQCIINQYLPGQGISPHIDRTAYGSTIACFSFGRSGREMQFNNRRNVIAKLYTVPGSLYIMQGDARYRWKHCMKERLSDLIGTKRMRRKTCFSVTFRNVPPRVASIAVV